MEWHVGHDGLCSSSWCISASKILVGSSHTYCLSPQSMGSSWDTVYTIQNVVWALPKPKAPLCLWLTCVHQMHWLLPCQTQPAWFYWHFYRVHGFWLQHPIHSHWLRDCQNLSSHCLWCVLVPSVMVATCCSTPSWYGDCGMHTKSTRWHAASHIDVNAWFHHGQW